jgi:hypothetical protein
MDIPITEGHGPNEKIIGKAILPDDKKIIFGLASGMCEFAPAYVQHPDGSIELISIGIVPHMPKL